MESFKDQYREAKEELTTPHMSPGPHGFLVTTTAYVDASHAENKATQIPHTRYHIPQPFTHYMVKQVTEHC